MKQKTSIIIFLLLATLANSQIKKTINNLTYYLKDTTYWYYKDSASCRNLKLNNLIKSTDTFHFRFWQAGQAIDIWTTDSKTYYGLATNHIERYYENNWEEGSHKRNNFYTNQITIDTGQARQAYYLILADSILTIPTDEEIKGWSIGNDGESFTIEHSTNTSYSEKHYWNPSSYDNLPEAKKIQAFIDMLNNYLNLGSLYSTIFNNLPNGEYENGGFGIIETDTNSGSWERFQNYETKWVQNLFKDSNQPQICPKYCGTISSISIKGSTFIEFDRIGIYLFSGADTFKNIFTNGLISGQMIYCTLSDFDKSTIDNIQSEIRCNPELKPFWGWTGMSFIINDIELLQNIKSKPTQRRFQFYASPYKTRLSDASSFYLELTNDKATNKTDMQTFIRGARVTFLKKPNSSLN